MAIGDVRTKEIDWRTLVLKAEPDFYAKRRKELFYKFSNGREFRDDPTKTGAYPDE